VGAAAPILQERACSVEVLGVPEVQEEGESQALAVLARDFPSVDRHYGPFGAGVRVEASEGLAAPAASDRAYYRSGP